MRKLLKLNYLLLKSNMEELILELKTKILEALKLQDMAPEDIDADAPLFKDGLGLDSIDSRRITASSSRALPRGRRSLSP